ncbi:MAG: hypothetical protein JWO23_929 [Solirubrobacterales bacterium]|jgi:hypothetical protein|nr:hypothetical protein [Solirubrobacterales bacterium]MCW3026586.1 hypothetical protein [Solirubrobacterales bacterium]
MPQQTQIDSPIDRPTRTQRRSSDVTFRMHQLEGSTQAALATLRRSLIEKVPPTRDGLAHEAAIAFDLEDDQQALALIDDIAQTVGVSALA